MLNFELYADIRFNRELDPEEDYISLDGYEMTMNGKLFNFDFMDYEGYIDKNDPSILHAVRRKVDFDSFPAAKRIRIRDLKHLESISDFFIFLGEPGESDLIPTELLYGAFHVVSRNSSRIIPFTKNVLQSVKFGFN
jgi:hypothetical protein